MKTKLFLTAILVAIFSVFSTLFVYSNMLKKTQTDQKNTPIEKTAPVVLTSNRFLKDLWTSLMLLNKLFMQLYTSE